MGNSPRNRRRSYRDLREWLVRIFQTYPLVEGVAVSAPVISLIEDYRELGVSVVFEQSVESRLRLRRGFCKPHARAAPAPERRRTPKNNSSPLARVTSLISNLAIRLRSRCSVVSRSTNAEIGGERCRVR